MKIGNLIEGKLEEMRIAGKTPAWIGLSNEAMESLVSELDKKKKKTMTIKVDGQEIVPFKIVQRFLNLRVCIVMGPEMPADGVYIQEQNEGTDEGF